MEILVEYSRFVRWALLTGLFVASASAQSLIDAGQVPALLREISQRPAEYPLGCGFAAIAPVLDFAFRFQAGYTFHLPAEHCSAGNHVWAVLTKVTPQYGANKPTWLLARTRTADVVRAGPNFEISGTYLLGQGYYTVESTLYDELGGSCRHGWPVRASLARNQRGVQLSLPPFAVRDVPGLRAADWKRTDSAAAVTVLLDAAPLSPRRIRLNFEDRDVLIRALTAVVGRIPAACIRLVIFSLDQQRELFRRDAFSIDAIGQAYQAMEAPELAAADVSDLLRPSGRVGFLASLITQELSASAPPSTVILIGPLSRHGGKFPKGVLNPTAATRFFYLQYKPYPQRSPSSAEGLPYPGQPRRAGAGVGDPGRDPPPHTEMGRDGDSHPSSTTPAQRNGRLPRAYPDQPSWAGIAIEDPDRGLDLHPEMPRADTDIINAAMIPLQGRTLVIRTPSDLAKAIDYMTKH